MTMKTIPSTTAQPYNDTAQGALRFLLVGLLLLIAAVLTGCKHNEPMRPAGYDFGMRVERPFETMIANAHPAPVKFQSVYFAFDSADLNEESRLSIYETAKQIREQGRPVAVIGHADIVNTETYNYDLGLDRALAVRNELWRAGVPKDWMFVRSRGKLEPHDTNVTDAGRALNRRVEIVMQPFGPGRSGVESMRMLELQRRDQEGGDDSAGALLQALVGGAEQ